MPNPAQPTVADVRAFWEGNPLFTGESAHTPGTRAFFDEHRAVVIRDCFAGQLDEHIFPDKEHAESVLDLGCGPGVWSVELAQRGAKKVTAADLTEAGLALARKRAEIYGVQIETSRQNAEAMTFPDATFTHVNCQGVIHHTPDTERCAAEIARVLRPGGTATISVYYRNIFLRAWPLLRLLGKLAARLGAGLRGRGREDIFAQDNPDEIVRIYDGAANPLGKSYTREQFVAMLTRNGLRVDDVYFHFFPARTLPVKIPMWLHRRLDSWAGFMIFANCTKPGG